LLFTARELSGTAMLQARETDRLEERLRIRGSHTGGATNERHLIDGLQVRPQGEILKHESHTSLVWGQVDALIGRKEHVRSQLDRA
jgi:hypothetical protein